GLRDLRAAGVKMLGYVRTNYANRDGLAPLSQVDTDVSLYHDHFNVDGIFLDEAASGYPTTGVDPNAIANYYKLAYDSIHSFSNPEFRSVVIGPGTRTNEEYFARPATETSVIFENNLGWEAYIPDSYVRRYPRKNFAFLLYDVTGIKNMKHAIDLAVERNIGYVYVTDCGPSQPSCLNPWNGLPTYWEEELAHIERINAACRPPRRGGHEHEHDLAGEGSEDRQNSLNRQGHTQDKCSIRSDKRERSSSRK
ncbi:MAG: spherulation-specific family 4 protein, partial [Nitrospirota bacterium]|nr:spherulation-specific family 4 protein [Nitrospirota bacterium]